MVSSAMPSSSSTFRNSPMCMSCSTMPQVYSSASGYCSLHQAMRSSLTCVRKCMRVPLHHTNQGLSAASARSMKLMASGDGLVVDGLHALLGERAGVLDGAVGGGSDHAAGAELLAEGAAVGQHHVARIVLVLRFLLGVEVVEVAVELVEAVVGGQVLVAVAEVVLAELTGHVAVVFEDARDGRVLHAACPVRRRAGRPWKGRCGRRSGP
jgi:hypothetical protein